MKTARRMALLLVGVGRNLVSMLFDVVTNPPAMAASEGRSQSPSNVGRDASGGRAKQRSPSPKQLAIYDELHTAPARPSQALPETLTIQMQPLLFQEELLSTSCLTRAGKHCACVMVSPPTCSGCDKKYHKKQSALNHLTPEAPTHGWKRYQ